jgi:hypothetical protein
MGSLARRVWVETGSCCGLVTAHALSTAVGCEWTPGAMAISPIRSHLPHSTAPASGDACGTTLCSNQCQVKGFLSSPSQNLRRGVGHFTMLLDFRWRACLLASPSRNRGARQVGRLRPQGYLGFINILSKLKTRRGPLPSPLAHECAQLRDQAHVPALAAATDRMNCPPLGFSAAILQSPCREGDLAGDARRHNSAHRCSVRTADT